MAFNFNNSGAAFAGASAVSISTALTTNGNGVNVGDLIVIIASDDTGDISSITTTGGSGSTNTYTALALNSTTGTARQKFFYCLSSLDSGAITFQANYAATSTGRGICVAVFDPTGTVSLDGSDATGGAATGTALASGSITTTSADGIMFGAGYLENANTFSAPLIKGSAATSSVGVTEVLLWWAATTASAGTAAATQSASGRWLCSAAAFANTGGGASPPPQMGRCIYMLP
jgi:hypothetical protein